MKLFSEFDRAETFGMPAENPGFLIKRMRVQPLVLQRYFLPCDLSLSLPCHFNGYFNALKGEFHVPEPKDAILSREIGKRRMIVLQHIRLDVGHNGIPGEFSFRWLSFQVKCADA